MANLNDDQARQALAACAVAEKMRQRRAELKAADPLRADWQIWSQCLSELHAELLLRAFGGRDKCPAEWWHVGSFEPGERWPEWRDTREIAVYPVTRANEGFKVVVGAILRGPAQLTERYRQLFSGKFLLPREQVVSIANKIARELGTV